MGEGEGWRRVRTEWRDVVLVCRKCAKKLDGGFGPDGDESLSKALRNALDDGHRRKVKTLRREVAVVEVGCLDICPKKAVVVARAGDPGSVLLVPKGAGMGEVLARLGMPAGQDEAEVSEIRTGAGTTPWPRR